MQQKIETFLNNINSISTLLVSNNYLFISSKTKFIIGILKLPQAPTCFKENTKILTKSGYRLIQDLKVGDLIKTTNNFYKPIVMIGKNQFYHSASKTRVKNQLYKCNHENYPEVFEDLIITGCHSILVNEFKNEREKEGTIKINGEIFVTDKKYRLPVCIDERSCVFEKNDNYIIYHFALENDDYYANYGVYANGLLVETCSKRYLSECSGMCLL